MIINLKRIGRDETYTYYESEEDFLLGTVYLRNTHVDPDTEVFKLEVTVMLPSEKTEEDKKFVNSLPNIALRIREIEFQSSKEDGPVSEVRDKPEEVATYRTKGWYLPEGTRKHHFFMNNGISLCKSYRLGDTELIVELEPDHINSCKDCRDRLSTLEGLVKD